MPGLRGAKLVSKAKNAPLPLDFGLLEIDEDTHCPAAEIVETLGGVLAGQVFGAFQLDH